LAKNKLPTTQFNIAMKTTSLFTVLLLTAGPLSAATVITETFSMSTSATIPDGDLSGLVQTITPATTIASVDSITITLNTAGGWNGDLYAYLWHNGTLSVLVNRPGRTAANLAGSATSGMTLTLADSATTDLHNAPGALSGTFQPDGRDFNPTVALNTSPRTDLLADFTSSPASGDWRLFIADVSTGDEATLTSWSVSITGPTSVPESSSALFLLAAAGLATRRRRQ
jgi:MYXO-CTERM domain-containing protein